MATTKVSPDLLDLDAGITISVADNSTNLNLVSTDDDANAGPNLDLYRNSTSPADSDLIGQINWFAENDADEKIEYAEIRAYTNDVSDGSEDVRMIIQTATAGSIGTSRIEILPTETVINQDSKDLDFRVESDNDANALFVQGSDGHVGIGTASPSVPLDIVTALSSDTQSTPETVLTLATKYTSTTGVDGAAGAGPRLEFKIPDDETNPITGAAIAGIKENGDDSDASAGMAFYISQNDTTLDEAVRIDSSGNTAIGVHNGTRAPQVLSVYMDEFTGAPSMNTSAHFGGGNNSSGYLTGGFTLGFSESGTNQGYRKVGIFAQGQGSGSAVQNLLLCVRTNTDAASLNSSDAKISISGTDGVASGDFNDTSDIGFKENIQDIPDSLSLVNQLQPRTFTWKGPKAGRGNSTGFIAQEVETVIPLLISGNNLGSTIVADEGQGEDGVDTIGKSINTIGLVAHLTKAIQELTTKLEAAEARITTLEGE